MGVSNFKAIPTSYDGINFRSRLEAKWAAFFHLMGWKYEYEPIDLDGYIPDFVLTGCKIPIYVEVKPALTMKELQEMCDKARRATLGKKLLCLGATIGYPEEESGFSFGSFVSRINLCDEDVLERYAEWFGNGDKDSNNWRKGDKSAEHCILGYHEEADTMICKGPVCWGNAVPISPFSYRKCCPFCDHDLDDVRGINDYKKAVLQIMSAWKEAGNIIQYRYAKTS